MDDVKRTLAAFLASLDALPKEWYPRWQVSVDCLSGPTITIEDGKPGDGTVAFTSGENFRRLPIPEAVERWVAETFPKV